MQYLDLVWGTGLIVLMGLGSWKGPKPALIGLTALAGGYGAAYLIFKPLGRLIEDLFEYPPLLSYAVGAASVFSVTFTVIILALALAALIRKKAPEPDQGGAKPFWGFRLSGAASWGLLGFFLFSFVIWSVNLLQVTPAGRSLPRLSRTWSGQCSGAVFSLSSRPFVKSVLKNTEVSFTLSHCLGNPGRTMDCLQRFFGHPKVIKLAGDTGFQSAALKGDTQALLDNPLFNSMLDDEELSTIIVELGLLRPGLGERERKRRAAGKVAVLGSSFRALRDDPDIRQILMNGMIRNSLMEMDMKWLIKDPKFHHLMSRVIELAAELEAHNT